MTHALGSFVLADLGGESSGSSGPGATTKGSCDGLPSLFGPIGDGSATTSSVGESPLSLRTVFMGRMRPRCCSRGSSYSLIDAAAWSPRLPDPVGTASIRSRDRRTCGTRARHDGRGALRSPHTHLP